MEQFYSQVKLGFEIVTGTETVTSKSSPGSAVQTPVFSSKRS
jgi:hypothetical protein